MKRMKVLILTFVLAMAMFGCGSEEDVRGEITSITEEASEVAEEEATSEEVAESEELVLGINDGAVYESEFIGLGYQLNDGWTFFTDEEIKELNNATADVAGEEYQELINEAELVYDMYACDSEGLNNINVNLEKVNPVQLIALDIAKNFELLMPTMETAYENMGYANFEYEVSKVEIDGKEVDVAYVTAEINGVNLYQTLFAVKCSGYLANVCVTTYFEDTTSQIVDNIYWLE